MVLIIGATLCVALAGAIGYAHAPSCALSSPIVYHWTLAVLLLYAAFVGLVLLVPLLSAALPFLAVGLTVIIDHLVGVASWMSEAGKRGAFGAASTLQRWLSVGAGGAEPPQQPTIANPQSTFALYVNTAALVWLYGYMLIEVVCSWRLACDVPLTTFVLGASGLGLSMALSDFVTDVFKNPVRAPASRPSLPPQPPAPTTLPPEPSPTPPPSGPDRHTASASTPSTHHTPTQPAPPSFPLASFPLASPRSPPGAAHPSALGTFPSSRRARRRTVAIPPALARPRRCRRSRSSSTPARRTIGGVDSLAMDGC